MIDVKHTDFCLFCTSLSWLSYRNAIATVVRFSGTICREKPDGGTMFSAAAFPALLASPAGAETVAQLPGVMRAMIR
jgi:hypothetical protein